MPTGKYDRKPLHDRVVENIAFGDYDECWKWLGYNANCNGMMRPAVWKTIDNKKTMYLVSRYLFSEVYNVELERWDIVRHTCDNPSCVNPFHLLVGSQQDNVNDMYERKRESRKLTDAQILEIRNSDKTNRELGQLYNVNRAHISHIQRKKSWKNLH